MAALTVACGDVTETLGTPDNGTEPHVPMAAPARQIAQDTTSAVVGLYPVPESREMLFYAAPVVVVCSVESVEGPFWNTADGQKWEEISDKSLAEGGDYTSPILYREITIRVEDVIRNEMAVPDDRIEFIALGGGTHSQDQDPLVGGDFREGERLVLFLTESRLRMRERPIPVYEPFYLRHGVFHVTDEGLVFADVVLEATAQYEAEGLTEFLDPLPDGRPLGEFLTAVEASRDQVVEAWEPYRPRPGDAAVVIEQLMELLEAGDLSGEPVKPSSQP